MKKTILLTLLVSASLFSQELKVKANSFSSDEKAGVSIFEGSVNITKGNDELNASKVTIYTDTQHEPTKFVAVGNASFYIQTLDGSLYQGKAQKVIYKPIEKEYHFYKNVHLKQINDKKEIIGEEVVLKTIEGKAYAKGAEKEPVIMIFKIPKDQEKKK
jgi:lipopolysaccharide export system protein LptA